VTETTIRPTTKFLKAGAIGAAIVVIALDVLCYRQWGFGWQMAVPLVLMLWPAKRAMRRQLTRVTITGDRLRYEVGVASKSTRTIQLSKLQDVRVDQGLMQRMFNVGNLSLETSGETSRLTIPNVDNPQSLADDILNRGQAGLSSQTSSGS
jgi:membrane protein YdbS with pleckstrin-like domain